MYSIYMGRMQGFRSRGGWKLEKFGVSLHNREQNKIILSFKNNFCYEEKVKEIQYFIFKTKHLNYLIYHKFLNLNFTSE